MLGGKQPFTEEQEARLREIVRGELGSPALATKRGVIVFTPLRGGSPRKFKAWREPNLLSDPQGTK